MFKLDPKAAVVVLSGGQDSMMCLFWAQTVYEKVHALTFDYGQRHRVELRAARDLCKIAKPTSHEVLTLGAVMNGCSPLTNPVEELETYSSFAQMEQVIGNRVEKTFVPLRNALFLTLAANRAFALGAGSIVTGVCQADNANYPDCRESFIRAQEKTFQEATDSPLQIVTPLMYTSKADSVRLAHAQGWYMNLAFTHTAYDGNPIPVGLDHASVLRAQGFLDAGLPDPLVIRAWHEGLMSLPPTPNYADVTYCSAVAEAIDGIRFEHGIDPLLNDEVRT